LSSYFHGWYVHNARGDVVQLVGDTGGVVLRTYRYTAFGVELSPVEGDTNPWRFAGEYFDRETGTYYLRFRNMNPRTGRFLTPDPFWGLHNMMSSAAAIVQSGNLFMYVMHNPVRFVDPWGLALVNAIEYARAMGARATEYIRADGARGLHITYNGISRNFSGRSGSIYMQDSFLNHLFGWNCFLNQYERDSGVGIHIEGGICIEILLCR